jgi:hypothetical protein
MTGKRTMIAISAAVALGIVGAASVAKASDKDEDRGGFVMPGSMVGVNPAFHPDVFGRAGFASRARNAYGYAASPIQKHRAAHEQTKDR